MNWGEWTFQGLRLVAKEFILRPIERSDGWTIRGNTGISSAEVARLDFMFRSGEVVRLSTVRGSGASGLLSLILPKVSQVEHLGQ